MNIDISIYLYIYLPIYPNTYLSGNSILDKYRSILKTFFLTQTITYMSISNSFISSSNSNKIIIVNIT